MEAIDIKTGSISIGGKRDTQFRSICEFQRLVSLQQVGHIRHLCLQLPFDHIGSLVRHMAVELRHRTHSSCQLINDGRCPLLLKHTTCYDAESVDEFPTVFVVLKQIEEQTDNIRRLVFVEYLAEIAFHGPGIEGIVEVEKNKAIAAVVLVAIGFDIVDGPVVVAQEDLCGHIISEFIDV